MRKLFGALLHGMVYLLVVMFSYHPLFAKSREFNTNNVHGIDDKSAIFSRNVHLESTRKWVRGCCNLIRHQTDKHPINSTRYLKYEFGRRQLCVPSMPMERTHRSGHSLQHKVFVPSASADITKQSFFSEKSKQKRIKSKERTFCPDGIARWIESTQRHYDGTFISVWYCIWNRTSYLFVITEGQWQSKYIKMLSALRFR